MRGMAGARAAWVRAWMLAWMLAVMLAGAGAAHSQAPTVTLRAVAHDGFSRLEFGFAQPTTAGFARHGDVVTLDFGIKATIVPAPGFRAEAVANLNAASFGPGLAILTLPPGVSVHSSRAGNSRVVDLFDPPGQRLAALPPAGFLAAAPVTFDGSAMLALVQSRVPDAAITHAAAVSRLAGPAAEAAALPAAPGPEEPQADAGGVLSLGFSAQTGAAAFRRGPLAVIVFDEARALDMDAIRAFPGFRGARTRALAQATVLMLTLPVGSGLRLAHVAADWQVSVVAEAPGPAAGLIGAQATAGRLVLDCPHAAGVVTIPDPITGDNLLVGTQHEAAGRIGQGRRLAEFFLLPSWLGVVVEPLGDRPVLRASETGFVVQNGMAGPGLALSAAAAAPPSHGSLVLAAAGLSRLFSLPDLPGPELLRRLHAQTVESGSAAPGARLAPRVAVAQTMLALGMGAEAQAVLRLAVADDPRGLADPRIAALTGTASILAGRLDEAAALAQPAASGEPAESDERGLWRALYEAAKLEDGAAPTAGAVAALARGVPLLVSYPAGLRRSIVPLAADTLRRGGDLGSSAVLLAQYPDDPSLDLARAALLQANANWAGALAGYDRLTRSWDRSIRARAAVAAIALRVDRGQFTPARAADVGERLFYAWRGDRRELDLRLQVAAWRGQAGQFRQQLATLREARDVFPDRATGIQAQLAAAFADIVHNDRMDRLSPLDLVALVEENGDLLPQGEAGEVMVGKLAERLAALDLPARAEPVLERLMHNAATAGARGAFGARLAAMQVAEGASAAALATLADSNSDQISARLNGERQLIEAQAQAGVGDQAGALVTLNKQATAGPAGSAVLLERASLLEAAHDWPAAEAALLSYAATAVPAAGVLDGAQTAIVLRLASAAAQVGDEARLAQIQASEGGRLADASARALLGVLTERPVQSVADLPRAAREATAARAVPANLQAMAHAPSLMPPN